MPVINVPASEPAVAVNAHQPFIRERQTLVLSRLLLRSPATQNQPQIHEIKGACSGCRASRQ